MGSAGLVILDRDGVINHDSDAYIKSSEEWLPIAGSIEAIARLKAAGYAVYIATNQSGLARGLFAEADLDAMHAKMESLLAEQGATIDGLFYCDHLPDAGCDCRKPGTGLLDQIEADWKNSVSGHPFIGDSMKDLQAGVRKGCLPVLLRTGKGEKTERDLGTKRPEELQGLNIPVYDSLKHAVDDLLTRNV